MKKAPVVFDNGQLTLGAAHLLNTDGFLMVADQISSLLEIIYEFVFVGQYRPIQGGQNLFFLPRISTPSCPLTAKIDSLPTVFFFFCPRAKIIMDIPDIGAPGGNRRLAYDSDNMYV